MVHLLLQRGHDVTTYDNLSTGHRDAILGGRYEFGDLGDSAALDRVFQTASFDAVMLAPAREFAPVLRLATRFAATFREAVHAAALVHTL